MRSVFTATFFSSTPLLGKHMCATVKSCAQSPDGRKLKLLRAVQSVRAFLIALRDLGRMRLSSDSTLHWQRLATTKLPGRMIHNRTENDAHASHMRICQACRCGYCFPYFNSTRFLPLTLLISTSLFFPSLHSYGASLR